MRRGTYKFRCLECGEATCFRGHERTQAAGMRCDYCGSRRMEPSKKSVAKYNIAVFHSAKVDCHERIKEKMGIISNE